MEQEIAPSPPWTQRLAIWWRGLFGPAVQQPQDFKAGGDYVPGSPAANPYDPARAMASMGRFGWVYATVGRTGTDLSRLPIRASAGPPSGKAKALKDHPFLRLLDRPSPDVSGKLFRSQLIIDRRLTGNAYAVKIYDGRRVPVLLRRLHPESMSPLTGANGAVLAYRYQHGGETRDYDRSAIIHVRGASWASGPAESHGTGMIEPLNQDLATDWALQKRMAAAATQGRPAGFATPKEIEGKLNPEAVAVARKELKKILDDSNGGIALLGSPLELTKLDYAPSELQALEARQEIVKQILAVAGVPPVRVGIEAANYATAQQQGETYWGDELSSEAELFDAEFTYHARLDFGPADLYLWHDFADVPALQALHEARLRRVSTHILNGMDPVAAYAYEGLEEAPIAPGALDAPAPEPEAAPAPSRSVASDWWPTARARGPELLVRSPPRGDWNAWRSQLQTPAEVKLRAVSSRLLREQRGRVVERCQALAGDRSAPLHRDVWADLVALLLPAEEQGVLKAGYEPALRRALERAVRWGSARVERDMPDSARLDPLVEQQLGALVADVSDATRADVGELVRRTLGGGGSIRDVQQQLQDFHSFGPARALRIARTEATRSSSAGAVHAWRSIAGAEAIQIRKGWMAKPSSRAAHLLLDGTVVGVDDLFTVPSGAYAGRQSAAPGGFGVAGLDINCTCGLKPIVED